jgi:hypothetical protein
MEWHGTESAENRHFSTERAMGIMNWLHFFFVHKRNILIEF